MPSVLRANAKTFVRRVTRRYGYDVVPLASGMVSTQCRVLADVDLVLDVGANVGQYGERLRDIGYTGKIISFEPEHDAFRILSTKSRGDNKWEARNLALGESRSSLTLHVSENSVSSSLLLVDDAHLAAAPKSREVRTEVVNVSTLDEEAPKGPASIYLKLDVQGYEQAVLDGGTATIPSVNAIQLEVSFDALYRGQASWNQLCAGLVDLGYVLRYIEPGYEDPHSGYMLQADFLFVRSQSR